MFALSIAIQSQNIRRKSSLITKREPCEIHCGGKRIPRLKEGHKRDDHSLTRLNLTGPVRGSLISDKHMHAIPAPVQGSLIADKHMHAIPAPVQGSLIADKHMHEHVR